MADKKIRVTVWNEYEHEREDPDAQKIYPDGIQNTVKRFLDLDEELEVTAVSLDMPDQGLPEELLNNTDVLIWWGHMAHWKVEDALVDRIIERVYR